ncbi:laminin subunit alpha-4-like [Xyrichtys novacula]|uniref:Laminin subunit alpha-4-like n=1 Tax=Xyrichtys novacula TaxID=13765 RepID=A0AAV1FGY5_XYRNO|nr:laminin subunit alpha-4-like [Xyrichtys novacula]
MSKEFVPECVFNSSVERSSFHLLVDGICVTDGHLLNDEGSSLDLLNPGHNIPMNSVVGCVREFKMNEEAVGEPEGRHKFLPRSDRLTETGIYFGGGHIVKGWTNLNEPGVVKQKKESFFPKNDEEYFVSDDVFTLSSQFMLSFEPPFLITWQVFSVSLFLKENKVVVRVNVGTYDICFSVTSPESLCDGQFHLVTVSRQNEVIKLGVDSSAETFKEITLTE